MSRVTLTASWVVPVDRPPVREGRVVVEEGRVAWVGADGRLRDRHVNAFGRAQGSGFLFKRDTVSMHNTSAPDIWIGSFEPAAPRRSPTLILLAAAGALGVVTLALHRFQRAHRLRRASA